MKKIFTLLAVAALAISANAENLYMVGKSTVGPDEGGLPAEWSMDNPAVFDYVDGKYQITVNGLEQFKISTVTTSWSDFDSAAKTCKYGRKAGVTVNLENGTGNIFCPWTGDWTVVVAGDLSTITMTTTTPQPADMTTKLYLRGEMNEWGATAEWQLTAIKADELYRFVCPEGVSIPYGKKFKIADGSWGDCNFGYNSQNGDIRFDVDTQLEGGDNPDSFGLESEWNGVCWFDLETRYVFFSNDKSEAPEWAAYDFAFTNEEQTLTYTVLDWDAKTCGTKSGTGADKPGNDVSGELSIPSTVSDGNTDYTVVSIGDYSFANCIYISSVTIPESVTSIGEKAFSNCDALTTVTFPNSITSIGNSSFANCGSLDKVYYKSEDPISGDESIFEGMPETATLYVPKSALEKYKTINPWKLFKNIEAYDDMSDTGIDEIITAPEAEKACEVYNLSGVKVGNATDNLPAGLYIVRQGNTVKKVAVK